MAGPSDDVLRTIQQAQTSPGVSPRTRQEANAAVPQGFDPAQRASVARDTVMATAEAARAPGAQGVAADPDRANRVLQFLRGLAQMGQRAGGALGQQVGSFSFSQLNPLELNRGLFGGGGVEASPSAKKKKKTTKKKAKSKKKVRRKGSMRGRESLEK